MEGCVQASLAQYRDRYHDLLNQELALSVRIALRNDLRSLTMTSEAQVESVMTSSGLPQTLTPGAPPPRLPFKAPFSSALPSVRAPSLLSSPVWLVVPSVPMFVGAVAGRGRGRDGMCADAAAARGADRPSDRELHRRVAAVLPGRAALVRAAGHDAGAAGPLHQQPPRRSHGLARLEARARGRPQVPRPGAPPVATPLPSFQKMQACACC